MQFEELQQEWQRFDQKLDRSLVLQAEVVRRVVMQPARRRVNRFAIWPVIDLVFCAVGLLLAGSSLGKHWRDWQVAAPAIVVMISAIALAASSILQLQRVAELDWCGPVAELQTALERLRTTKIRQFKWIILFSPFVGFYQWWDCTGSSSGCRMTASTSSTSSIRGGSSPTMSLVCCSCRWATLSPVVSQSGVVVSDGGKRHSMISPERASSRRLAMWIVGRACRTRHLITASET